MADTAALTLARRLGRTTPVSSVPIDAKAQADLIAALAKSIADLEKVAADANTGALDSLTKNQRAVVEGHVGRLQAIATMKLAGANAMQARADAMRAEDATFQYLTSMVLTNSAPDDVMQRYGVALKASVADSTNSMKTKEYAEAIKANASDADKAVDALADKLVGSYRPAVVAAGVNELNGIQAGAIRVNTVAAMADAANKQLSDAARVIAADLDKQFASEGKRLSGTDELLQAAAAKASARLVGGAVTNADGTTSVAPGTLMAQLNPGEYDTAARQYRTAQAYRQQADDRINSMKSGPAGEDRQLLGILDQMRTSITTSPADWGSMVGKMEAAPGAVEVSKTLQGMLKGVQDAASTPTPDPLLAAIADMRKRVPNFDRWSTVMRFRTPEDAALYAAKFPGEVKKFNEIVGANPDLLNTSRERDLRAALSAEGKSAGWGFYVTPLGRALRLPRGGVDRAAQAAAEKVQLPLFNPQGLTDRANDVAADASYQGDAAANATNVPDSVTPIRGPSSLSSTQNYRDYDPGDGFKYRQWLVDRDTAPRGSIDVTTPNHPEPSTLLPGDQYWQDVTDEIKTRYGVDLSSASSAARPPSAPAKSAPAAPPTSAVPSAAPTSPAARVLNILSRPRPTPM